MGSDIPAWLPRAVDLATVPKKQRLEHPLDLQTRRSAPQQPPPLHTDMFGGSSIAAASGATAEAGSTLYSGLESEAFAARVVRVHKLRWFWG